MAFSRSLRGMAVMSVCWVAADACERRDGWEGGCRIQVSPMLAPCPYIVSSMVNCRGSDCYYVFRRPKLGVIESGFPGSAWSGQLRRGGNAA